MSLAKKWSVESYDGSEAEEVYTVDEVSTLAEARVYPGVPQTNTAYPDNASLKSRPPAASKAGFRMFEVRIRYGIPPNGEWDDIPIDPLDEPTEAWWELGTTTEPIDMAYDEENNLVIPITNSALDPIDPPIAEEFGTLYLHVEKTLAEFPVVEAQTFRNSTNEDAFTILGRFDVDPGQARCVLMVPTTSFRPTSLRTRVRLTLELRGEGFKRRVLDQGFNGWNVSDDKGPFCTGAGDVFANPVMLDGSGKPMNSTIKVHPASPEVAVSTNPTFPATGSAIDVESGSNGTWLKYKTKKQIAFAAMLAAFN